MFVELKDLLQTEMAEQLQWTTLIPAWHPRNEEPKPGESPKPDPANPAGPPKPPENEPPKVPGDPAASAAVASAYEKLRAAEKERDDAKKDAKKVPALQSELDQVRAENADLKKQALEGAAATAITSMARQLGYHKPERAMNALKAYTDIDPVTLDTEEKVKKALTDLAAAEKYLVGESPPSGGPVHQAGQQQGGHAAVNQALRRASGRT